MDPTFIIVAVVLVVVVMGAILGPVFARRRLTQRFQNTFGAEYNRTVETTGSEEKAQAELDGRRKHIETLKIRPLSADERQHYQADWAAVQAKFVDQPGQATIEADQLIMEVMKAREYPVSNFEQRAADISVNYPALVTNYRAARETSIRNEQQHAGTEDLRLAMLSHRSLFHALLRGKSVAPGKA